MKDEINSLLTLEKYGGNELLKAYVLGKEIVETADKLCTLFISLPRLSNELKELMIEADHFMFVFSFNSFRA